MNTNTQTVTTGTDLQQLLQRGQRFMSGGADWLADARRRGAEQVASIPLPDRKQEAWRYTPVSFLDQAHYEAIVEGPFEALRLDDIEDLLLEQRDAVRLVFVNGYFAPALSSLASDHAGVVLTTLSGALGDVPPQIRTRLDRIAEHRHVFAALNSALMSDGACILVSSGAQVQVPIEVLHVSVGLDEPGISHSAAAKRVKQAADYILARPCQSVTIGEICDHIGCSRRSLEQSFKKYAGTSPKHFIRILRLEQCRKALLEAGRGAEVKSIALQYGFWHMGQFSADYRTMFGELPSETLIRNVATA